MQRTYQVPSVHKAIDILELLRDRRRMTFKEIADTLRLPSSTCYNILNTLEARGLLAKDSTSGQYSLGVQLMQLGLRVYNDLDLRTLALPVMAELHTRFDETVYLSVLAKNGLEGIVIEKLDSPRTMLVLRQVGDRVPLYASATGKSLLSGLNEEELERYFNAVDLIPFSKTTIVDKEALLREVEMIRRNGYAITHDELNDGASAVSAPIRNHANTVVAAISLAGPVGRMQPNIPLMIPHIKDAAKRISEQLGYRP
ncbi:MAG: IclR family transcriptional regulator [Alicyclobacillus sp.]|nr:IclR family transcriptional regulator [Alicyclobacillus sp.]